MGRDRPHTKPAPTHLLSRQIWSLQVKLYECTKTGRKNLAFASRLSGQSVSSEPAAYIWLPIREPLGLSRRFTDKKKQWCNQDFFQDQDQDLNFKTKTKPSVQDLDQDFVSQNQDQDFFVMYTRGRPKNIFHFRP